MEKVDLERLGLVVFLAATGLEALKRLGFITRYARQVFMRDGSYHLVAYTGDLEGASEWVKILNEAIPKETGVPFVITLHQEEDGR